MRGYFDGSYGNDASGDEWVTLGGIAATDAAWDDFENRWERMLRERYPIAPYIHMIALMKPSKVFDSPEWTDEKIEALIGDGIDVLNQVDKSEFRMYTCSFNLSARERIIAENASLPDPIITCVDRVAMPLLMWHQYVVTYPSTVPRQYEPIYVFFDRNEKFHDLLKKEWLINRTDPWKSSDTYPDQNHWDVFANIQETDLPRTYGIQAADMIAWAYTRTLPGHPPRWFSDMKERFVKCVAANPIVIDEYTMRERVRSRSIDDGAAI
jgi:hypothetical protein